MNNNEFDNKIRESLEGFSVAPSTNVAKSIGRKMLLKNIWFFHKKKALLILLLTGVAGMTYINTNNVEPNIEISSNTVSEDSLKKNTTSIEKENLLKNKKKEKETIESFKVINEELTRENVSDSKLANNKNSSILGLNKTQDKLSAQNNKTNHITLKNNKTTSSKNNNHLTKRTVKTINNSIRNNKIEIKPLITSHTFENSNIAKFKKRNARLIENEFENELISFQYSEKAVHDYVKEKNGKISIDAFFTPYNQTIVKNEVDYQYSKNWWDFYKEAGYVSSKMEAGVRVNYDWKNIVISSGVKLNRILDYKPTYIYESIENTNLLTTYGLSEISGVQVNGVDSAHYIFYTQNDDELISKLENEEYSTYSYLSIPIKLGYEFETKKFSILVQTGINYNKLIGAKGTYLRRYTNSETLDIYYNRGIETALLSRKNSMLNKSNISFLASLAGNIKVSSNIDIFGEFTFQKSVGSITKDEYFIQKKTANFGTNFGVKYYLKSRFNNNNSSLQEVF